MKNIKRRLLSVAVVAAFLSLSLNAHADDWYVDYIDSVSVHTGNSLSTSTLQLVTKNSDVCTGDPEHNNYIQVHPSNMDVAKMMLSVALTAKTAGLQIRVRVAAEGSGSDARCYLKHIELYPN